MRKGVLVICGAWVLPVAWAFGQAEPEAPARSLSQGTTQSGACTQAPQPDHPPIPVSQTAPEYPLTALARKLEGEVMVEFIVAKDGTVHRAHAVRSSNPIFEAAAVEAVARWVFEPGRKAGEAVNARLQVPIVFTPDMAPATPAAGSDKVNIALPFAENKAQVPRLPEDVLPVYPFRALLENQRARLTGLVEFDASGRAEALVWETPPPPEFARAVEAMLDAHGGRPADAALLTGKRRLWFNFDPHDGNVRVSGAGAAILKRLRTEGDDAAFAREQDLDAKLTLVSQAAPVFPSRLPTEVAIGEATIEFFVDATGQVQLPHALSASDPAFGYAACQAVAGWQYRPPLRNGLATTVRLTTTLKFGTR